VVEDAASGCESKGVKTSEFLKALRKAQAAEKAEKAALKAAAKHESKLVNSGHLSREIG